jgi:hypothetical protein
MQLMAWLPGKCAAMEPSSAAWKRRAAAAPPPRRLPTRPAPACVVVFSVPRGEEAIVEQECRGVTKRAGERVWCHAAVCCSQLGCSCLADATAPPPHTHTYTRSP